MRSRQYRTADCNRDGLDVFIQNEQIVSVNETVNDSIVRPLDFIRS